MKSFKFVANIALSFASISVLPGQSVQQNIDTACVQVLGSACSTTSTLSGTYQAIQIQINNKKLASDANSIVVNYLMPMVKSSVGWQMNLIDWAWPAAGCKGMVAESQWYGKFGSGGGQWQNYQQLLSMMKSTAGCTPIVAAPPVVVTQYLNASAMQAGYQTVWGGVANYAAVQTNCPVAIGAVNCARSSLASYVSSHGPAILGGLDTPVFAQVIGFSPDSNALNSMSGSFGRYWTGADDLRTYLTNTKSQWAKPVAAIPAPPVGLVYTPPVAAPKSSPIHPSGFLSNNGSAIELHLNSPSGPRLVTDLSGRLISEDARSLVAASGGNHTDPTTGLVTDSSGRLIVIYGLVASGAGNLVASGAGNLVASGAGNLVASGAGNLVASGAGNLVASGAGNFIYTTQVVAAYLGSPDIQAALVKANASSIITSNGVRFIAPPPPTVYSLKSVDPPPPPAASGACTNPDLTRAIQAVAGRAPSRTASKDECTAYNIPGIPYNDLLMNVGMKMGWPVKTCDDLSITQATLQVRNHLPAGSGTSGACNKAIYHWPWANYTALVTAVGIYGPQ